MFVAVEEEAEAVYLEYLWHLRIPVSEIRWSRFFCPTLKLSRDHGWRGLCCSEHNP
jgi:hypothetical protein